MKLNFKAKKYSNLSDQELVEVFRKHQNKVVAGELYSRYAHLVMGTCLKYLKNEEESKDAVMAIFEKLMLKMHEFEIQHFKSWLFQVSKNHCLMILRKAKAENNRADEWQKDFLQENMDYQETSHLYFEDDTFESDLQRMKNALEKLKPEQKQCVELFYLEEKSYQQVAEITGFSLKKVKSYLQNGKKNLQKLVLTVTLFPIFWLMDFIYRLIIK